MLFLVPGRQAEFVLAEVGRDERYVQMHSKYFIRCPIAHEDIRNGVSADPNADIMHIDLMVHIFPLGFATRLMYL